jgi:hypothetical protein
MDSGSGSVLHIPTNSEYFVLIPSVEAKVLGWTSSRLRHSQISFPKPSIWRPPFFTDPSFHHHPSSLTSQYEQRRRSFLGSPKLNCLHSFIGSPVHQSDYSGPLSLSTSTSSTLPCAHHYHQILKPFYSFLKFFENLIGF